MPLKIKDHATEQFVRELAGITGETATTAVRRATEERLYRVRRARAGGSLAAALLETGRRCSALPDLDTRTPDEIIGYNAHGLPS
ncbi:MAG TPA: type II toxin-antitoxin system VapB family antitoxin [Acetobacteraceae bacterium]|jgi:antitoxin VapB|nr:type II toxin-antitoxin system VapB family antitoxin [Acetobacteraceae bacterium]